MSESTTVSPDIAQLSYEQARLELVQIVQQLEAGGSSLEQSLALWEKGQQLAAHCEAWLSGAKTRLEQAQLQDFTAADNAESVE